MMFFELILYGLLVVIGLGIVYLSFFILTLEIQCTNAGSRRTNAESRHLSKTPLLIAISGVSGAGKTTLANALEAHFVNRGKPWVCIHQDDFYFPSDQIPKVELSTGHTVSKWDCDEAIDFQRMLNAVKDGLRAGNNVILEGFALPDDKLESQRPDYHIHLNLGEDMIAERREAQGYDFSEEKVEKQMARINELALPYYCQNLMNTEPDVYIPASASKREVFEMALRNIKTAARRR